MPLDIHGRDDRSMVEADLDLLRVRPVGNEQTGARMAEVVEAKRSQPRLLHPRQPIAPAIPVTPSRYNERTLRGDKMNAPGGCGYGVVGGDGFEPPAPAL
jgi:hypothetical protein